MLAILAESRAKHKISAIFDYILFAMKINCINFASVFMYIKVKDEIIQG